MHVSGYLIIFRTFVQFFEINSTYLIQLLLTVMYLINYKSTEGFITKMFSILRLFSLCIHWVTDVGVDQVKVSIVYSTRAGH